MRKICENVCIGVFNVNGVGWDSGRGTVMPKWEYIRSFVEGCKICGLNETRRSNVDKLMGELGDHFLLGECGEKDKGGQGVALIVHKSIRGCAKLWRVSEEMQLVWARVAGWVFGVSDGDVMVGVAYVPPITNGRGEEVVSQFFYTLMCEMYATMSF